MKYLKYFESKKIYKLNSYVLVNLEDINDPESHGLPTTKYTSGQISKCIDDDNFPYEVTITNGKKFQFHENEVVRYLTPEEIKKYKLESQTLKYNI